MDVAGYCIVWTCAGEDAALGPVAEMFKLCFPDGAGSPEPVPAGPETPAVARGDRREKMLKMLASLEDLQRSINKTRRTKITLVPRGKTSKQTHTFTQTHKLLGNRLIYKWQIMLLFVLQQVCEDQARRAKA